MGEVMLDGIKSSIPISSPYSPSPSRLWRPAAQRNVKNQWCKLLSIKNDWFSASSKGRTHATNLVNAYLERSYIPIRNLGVLNDMPRIREEACSKLNNNQELFCNKLVSSYKDMVVSVKNLVRASCSMRCYLKGSGSNEIIQYNNYQEDPNDPGDGGGVPIFSSLSMTYLEDLAHELVDMYRKELSLKRFLVIGLLSINCLEGAEKKDVLGWSDELYYGEIDDLTVSGMLLHDSYPIPPQIVGYEASEPLDGTTIRFPNSETLEMYLVTWITDLHIDKQRVDEIFFIVEEEMRPGNH